MCDLKAFVLQSGKEQLLLEAVNLIHAEGNEIIVRNLFGEEKRVHGSIREVSLVRNRITIEQK